MKRGVLGLLAAAFVAAGFSFWGNKVEALGTNYDSSAFVTTWKTDNPGTVNSSSINLTFPVLARAECLILTGNVMELLI